MDYAHLGALLACIAYLCLSRMPAKGRNPSQQLQQAAKLLPQGLGQEPGLPTLLTHASLEPGEAANQCSEPANKQSRMSHLTTEPPVSPDGWPETDSLGIHGLGKLRPATHSSSATLLSEPTADQPPAFATEPGLTYQAVAAQEPTATRRGYRVHAHIAPYQDDLSAIANYERVLCHDLSQTGVSFFRRDPLAGGLLIITLSQKNAPTIYMVASVVYSRPIIVRGDELYRISCRFVRRLESTCVRVE